MNNRLKNALGCCLILLTILAGCNSSENIDLSPPPTLGSSHGPTSDIAITMFCGDCHAMPNPLTFTKERWHHEVKQGIDLYRKSQRTDLVVPDFEACLAWFQKLAPEQMEFETHDSPNQEKLSLKRQQIAWNASGANHISDDLQSLSAVSSVAIVRGGTTATADDADASNLQIVLSDMGTGNLWLAEPSNAALSGELIGTCANPSHIEPADLDGDGNVDYVVADLGGFFPQRHRRGNIWWFRQNEGRWERHAIKMEMVRTSDVRLGDFDSDGDQDLIVAEFGWHFVGGIHLFTNIGTKGEDKNGVPQFEVTQIDSRPGAIHLPVVDFNGDGHLDFVALISQHHEAIEVFLGNGQGSFTKHKLFQAGDPAYGSSGIELVDFDQDGDLDVLYTNGDTFDDEIPKPIHRVQWLENTGTYPFKHHHIGQMPGAYRAVAGDVDDDGDMEVAAVALLTADRVSNANVGKFDGVVVFQQLQPGNFARHRLQINQCDSATCVWVDADHDGDLDLWTFPYDTSLGSSQSLTIYQNETR